MFDYILFKFIKSILNTLLVYGEICYCVFKYSEFFCKLFVNLKCSQNDREDSRSVTLGGRYLIFHSPILFFCWHFSDP